MAPTINHSTTTGLVTNNTDSKTETATAIAATPPTTISSATSTTTSIVIKANTETITGSTPNASASTATTTSSSQPEVDKINSNNNSTANNTNQSMSSSASSSSSTSASKRTSSSNDMDLKSSIIEFMRERPFLWNNKDPSYKDHKRREHEFQEFSKEIHYPVQEIKRVWHVLRTNFFRAHKLLIDRPHNPNHSHNNNNNNSGSSGENSGEKLWKYYLAMEYILEGTNVDYSNRGNNSNNNINNILTLNDDSCSSKETTTTPTPTRHLKSPRYLSNVSREPSASDNQTQRITNNLSSSSNNNINNNNNNTNQGGNNQFDRTSNRAYRNMNDNNNISLNSSINSNHHYIKSLNGSGTSIYNDSIMSTMEADDDHLYARSLTATLKKFDATTKEVIKLKFQEIIVEHMQKQQQQQQQQNKQTHSSIEQVS